MKSSTLAKSATNPKQAAKSWASRTVKAALISALFGIPGVIILVIILLAVAAGQSANLDVTAPTLPVSCEAPAAGDVPTLDATQDQNATTIIAVGKTRKVPEYGWVIAIATAMQESQLRNLPGGDRDSIGLFQQRPSQGWGTPEQVHDPTYAATAFYGGPDVPPDDKGLLDIPGWQSMPLTVAAQSVQNSGFPDAYAKWETLARNTVGRLGGSTQACPALAVSAPNAQTAAMVQVALQQIGKPYVWGGIGPNGFDCSGLIYYSWKQVGYTPAARNARDMYAVSSPLKPEQVQSGDMIFAEFGSRGLKPTEPGHIQLVVTPAKISSGKTVQPGTIVEAATAGTPVRTRPYDPFDPDIRFGRFPASALTPTR